MTFPTQQTVSQLGQINKTNNSRAMFLKLYAGEVLTQFRPNCMAMKYTRVRTISDGKSASFPMVGRATAKYHTPGSLIQGEKVAHGEVTVTIDDFLVSPVFISELDEAMNHFDVRQQYTKECADTLSEVLDRNVFRMIAKAAFIQDYETAKATKGLEGILAEEVYTKNIQLAEAGDEFVGDKLVDAIYKARTEFRKKNVNGQPYATFGPEQFEALVNLGTIQASMPWLNADYGEAQGQKGNGLAEMQGEKTNLRIAGIEVFESNHLPKQDETLSINDPEPLADATIGSARQDAYRGDYSNVVGLVFTKDAVCTVKLKEMDVRAVDEELRGGTTMLAKVAVGHNILRPACSIAILKQAA